MHYTLTPVVKKLQTSVICFFLRQRDVYVFATGSDQRHSEMMDKMGESQNSTVAKHAKRLSNRLAFRSLRYTPTGFLDELRNPGLWNDAVVEMVGNPSYHTSGLEFRLLE